MTRKEFDLLDAINREGLDNSEWGFIWAVMQQTPKICSEQRTISF